MFRAITLALVLIAGTIGPVLAAESEPRLSSLSGSISVSNAKGEAVTDRANVVVFIDGLTTRCTEAPARPPLIISHLDRTFSPRVVPIEKCMSLDFFNDDNIYHNVFSVSPVQRFDLGIYEFGTSKIVRFDNPGLVRIYCDIHPNMMSNVLILNNGLYAKTGEDGVFEIRDIPDGEYTVRVWHEFGEEVRMTMNFAGGAHHSQDFSIQQTRKILPHKNKFGKPYPEKY